ncbi:MAG: hypothetical protein ACJ0BC_04330 [Dehalococcoidia bacterium]
MASSTIQFSHKSFGRVSRHGHTAVGYVAIQYSYGYREFLV